MSVGQMMQPLRPRFAEGPALWKQSVLIDPELEPELELVLLDEPASLPVALLSSLHARKKMAPTTDTHVESTKAMRIDEV